MGFTRRDEQLTVRYDIEGMPTIDRVSSYNDTSTEFLPDGMEIWLDRVRTDPWRFIRAEISGGKLRKDGTPGLVVVSRSFYKLTGVEEYRGASPMPTWARELIEFHLAELNAGRVG